MTDLLTEEKLLMAVNKRGVAIFTEEEVKEILDNQEKVRTYQNYFNWMEREGMPFQPPKEQEEKMRSIRQIEQENKDLKERIETDFYTIKKQTKIIDEIKELYEIREFEGFCNWYLTYVNRDSKTEGSDNFESGIKELKAILERK